MEKGSLCAGDVKKERVHANGFRRGRGSWGASVTRRFADPGGGGPMPLGPDAIDAAWLSRVLAVADDRPVIDHVTHGPLIHGAGTKLRVDLRYRHNPAALPERLWIKAGWEPHSPALERVGSYAKEAHFYARLAEPSGARAPRCFAAGWDGDGRAFVVLEDLHDRGADLWNCRVARPVADVVAMLDTLARFHAAWWEDPATLAMPLVDVPMRATGPLAEWPRANGAERLNAVLSGPRGEGLPAHVRDGQRIERAFWRMVESLDTPAGGCLLHGDPHPGNCFSDADGGAGLYDWQTVARGPWAYDVAYMIVTALSVEDRRLHERALLDGYRDRLRAHGVAVPPDRDGAWELYRRHIAYPMLIWPTNHVTHQSEENIRALTYRLGMAADDFGFFDLWSV